MLTVPKKKKNYPRIIQNQLSKLNLTFLPPPPLSKNENSFLPTKPRSNGF